MNKHIELFKQIPCGNFGMTKLFFDGFKKKKIQDITFDDIVLAYYYIAEEMMDDVDSSRFIVRRNNTPYDKYDCHDPATGEHIFVNHEFKDAKLYNGVLNVYYNRTPKNGRRYGLVPTPKDKNKKIYSLIEDFRLSSLCFKGRHFRRDIFTNERRYCINNEELDQLYNSLKALCDKADFHYEQAGSIILAQEMANVMVNHDIIKDNQHTPYGVEYVKQHKLLMFGELQR